MLRCRIIINPNKKKPTIIRLPPVRDMKNALFNTFGSKTFIFATIFASGKATKDDLESLFQNGIEYPKSTFHFLCGERVKSRQVGTDASLFGANNVFKATFCSKDPNEIRAWIGTFDSQPGTPTSLAN